MSVIAQTGAKLLGSLVHKDVALQGGDLSQLAHVWLKDGREVVVKSNVAAKVEAGMLAAIKKSSCPVPEVLAFDDQVLVLSFVPTNGLLYHAWGDLGQQLAKLHATTAEDFGWAVDYAFGRVSIQNAPCATWPQFWAERRLLPFLGGLSLGLSKRVERLAKQLDSFLPLQPVRSLLHGDLWAGNVLVNTRSVSAFIDPACYFGHAEVDLAMLSLFDLPDRSFYANYGELGPGYELRRHIYQLWPLLVHLTLFGDSYLSRVDRALSATGN